MLPSVRIMRPSISARSPTQTRQISALRRISAVHAQDSPTLRAISTVAEAFMAATRGLNSRVMVAAIVEKVAHSRNAAKAQVQNLRFPLWVL